MHMHALSRHLLQRPVQAFPARTARALGRCFGLVAALAGCAPALDWREVRTPGHSIQALFPCKPSALERRVQLAGKLVSLTLQACTSGGQTWGLASADIGDPTLVRRTLTELGSAAALNIGAAAPVAAPMQVPGATPNPASQRATLQGALPDGTAVRMELAVFAHGTRVYQATVLGPQVPDEAAQTFLGALRIAP